MTDTFKQKQSYFKRIPAQGTLRMRHLFALLCWFIYREPLSKAANNLMSKGLRYCWANVQRPLIGREREGWGRGVGAFFHRINKDMKDITSLGKTTTVQYSK